MSSIKPEDHKVRRTSLSVDNNEVSKIFESKLMMAESIKRYVALRVSFVMKNFEENVANDLINRFMDDLDHATTSLLKKIEKN